MENMSPPSDPMFDDTRNRRKWIYIGIAAFVIVACCLVLVAGWFLGDYVLAWLGY